MSLELVDPFIRIAKYIHNNPSKRTLEVDGKNVWLKTEYGYSCIYAPHFDKIIAPTHDNLEPLFKEYE